MILAPVTDSLSGAAAKGQERGLVLRVGCNWKGD